MYRESVTTDFSFITDIKLFALLGIAQILPIKDDEAIYTLD